MIGNNVRTRREAAGMTQVDLAKRVDAIQSTISGIETGERQPSVDMLLRLAWALDCSLDDLARNGSGAIEANSAAAAMGAENGAAQPVR